MMTTPECPGYQRMIDTATKQAVPLSVHFELTYRCNLDCLHCYVVPDESRPELSYEEVCGVLDALAEAGCLFLTFTGGEVLVRPDFWDIASYARQKAFAVEILTNGTLIDKQVANRLAELAIGVEVSVYGASAQTHDRITRTADSHEATMKAVSRLKKNGVPVALKVPAMTENVAEVGKILDLAEEMEISCGIDPIITPRIDGSQDTLRLRISDQKLAELFSDRRLSDESKKRRTPAVGLDEEICASARRVCAISPYGDVFPCLLLPFKAGNLKDKAFADIWESAAILKQIRALRLADLPRCSTCDALPYCSPCLGLSYLESGALSGISPMACQIARVRQQLAENQ